MILCVYFLFIWTLLPCILVWHLAPQYFIKVFLSLCSHSHIGPLEKPKCFEDASRSCLWSFCVRLKMETRQMGFLFLDYTCKVIQNIQWGKGARWPRLLLSFTNFVSVKWTWLRGRPDYVTAGREPFINERRMVLGILVHWYPQLTLCVCVCERQSLWQYYREPL